MGKKPGKTSKDARALYNVLALIVICLLLVGIVFLVLTGQDSEEGAEVSRNSVWPKLLESWQKIDISQNVDTDKLETNQTFSFLEASMNGPRDIRFCGADGLRVQENGGDSTVLKDLGLVNYSNPDIPWRAMGNGGQWGTRSGYVPCRLNHVYVIHVRHHYNDFWVKMKVVEMESDKRIRFRWEILRDVPFAKEADSTMQYRRFKSRTSVVQLAEGGNDYELQMKDGIVKLQLRNCAAGGNPSLIGMTGVTNDRVDEISATPLDMNRPLYSNEKSIVYYKGGFIPPGKAWIINRVTYRCTGKAEFLACIKDTPVIVLSDLNQPFEGSRYGRIELHPGEEGTVFGQIQRGAGILDITIEGVLN